MDYIDKVYMKIFYLGLICTVKEGSTPRYEYKYSVLKCKFDSVLKFTVKGCKYDWF